MSAVDFVRLNNKDQLINPDMFATKNDGSQQYFYFRDIVLEKLSQLIKRVFQQHVSSAAFTLDKVTVQHPS